MKGLIGFEDSYNTTDPVLTPANKQSDSGLLIGPSLHPLLSFENLLALSQRFAPGRTATSERAAVFNEFLSKKYDTSVLKLFQTLFVEKKIAEVTKTIIQNVNLYEGVGNIAGRITKGGRMVGYKIKVNHRDTIALLSHIGLQLDTIQNGLELYLYHSSDGQPVKTFTINHTRSVQFQWHKVTSAILSHINDTINPGGAFYLTYYEADLLGSAIKKQISFGSGGCGTCSEQVVNTNLYNKWSKYISIQPFYVNAANLPEDKLLWDETLEVYVDDTNWGMNVQLSVQCDVTDTICRSRNIVADALAKQITVDLLTEMAYTLRDNQTQSKAGAHAAAALDNQEGGQYGEAKRLQKAVEALSFDFSSMNEVCLPCQNKSTSKVSSVWAR